MNGIKRFAICRRYDGTLDIECRKTGRSFIGNKNESGYALIYDVDNKKDLKFTTTNHYGQSVCKRFSIFELGNVVDELCKE